MQRRTKQRDAIWQVIQTSGRPLTAQEIQMEAATSTPGLGIATVYRTIKSHLEEGLLVEVAVPGHISRYEVAGLPHHHHFYCGDCEKLYELNACPGGVSGIAPSGFKVDQHFLMLVGSCPDCVV